jgi:hypothetical protein
LLYSLDKEAASIAHLRTSNDEYVYVAHHAVAPPKAKRHHKVNMTPARTSAGRLRLSRTGSTLHYLIAGEDDQFVQVRKLDVGTQDVALVRVAVHPGGSRTGASVLFTSMDIRSEELPIKPSESSPSTGWLVIELAGLALVAMAGGGVAWWWYIQRIGRAVPG